MGSGEGKLFGHDDFEREIEELLLPAEIDEKKLDIETSARAGREIFTGVRFLNTPRSLRAVCTLLGVTVKQAPSFSFIRDRFLRLPNQNIATAHQSPFCLEAAKRVHSSNLYLNKAAAAFTNNQLFNGWSGSTLPVLPSSEERGFFSQEIRSFSFTYAEGGNVFCLTNAACIVKVCMGKDHLLQTLLLQELASASWEHLATCVKKDFSQLHNDLVSSLTDAEIFVLVEEMYSLGLLFVDGQSGLIKDHKLLELLMVKFYLEGKNTEKKTDFKEIVHSARLAPKLLCSGYITTAFRKDAAEYAAKIAITKGLIAKDYGVEEGNVHYITQSGYHLDSFLTPGPEKTIFINSYRAVYELLKGIERDKEALKLSFEDGQLLEGYIETAKKLDRELSDLLMRTKIELEDAGFKVVEMPMHFVYESVDMYQGFPVPSTLPNAYFGNAITGWSEKEKMLYYIAHGAQCGEKLGKIFMDSFKASLLPFGNIRVFFVGNNIEDREDFSEALDFWGRLDMQSGIHCASIPLRFSLTQRNKEK